MSDRPMGVPKWREVKKEMVNTAMAVVKNIRHSR